ncbi:MAG TPA: hypothetical protein VN228_01920 [Pyrinomonadaceae bacterium]|nr:hypothetical protein [Pyrinomonadaceae bacterium]
MNGDGRRRLTACALPLLLLAALGAQGGSCAGADADGRGGRAPMAQGGRSKGLEGAWGGTGARLEVGEAGAEVEFDCAHGTLESPAPDAAGGFDARGTFTRERGGPVREGAGEERLPARYSGKVEGDTMTLRVEAEGVAEALTFTLTRGSAGRLRKCL